MVTRYNVSHLYIQNHRVLIINYGKYKKKTTSFVILIYDRHACQFQSALHTKYVRVTSLLLKWGRGGRIINMILGHTEYNVYVYSVGLTELVRIAYIRNQQSKWALMYVWSRIDWAQKDLGIVCSRKYT